MAGALEIGGSSDGNPLQHRHLPGHQVAVRQGSIAKDAVDALLDDVDPPLPLAHRDRDLRKIGEKPGDRGQQEMPREGTLNLNSKLAARHRSAKRPLGVFDVVEDCKATTIIGFSIEGRPDGTGGSLEQADPEPVLELLDDLRRGRSRDVQIVRGLGEASPFDHSGEEPHGSQSIHAIIPILRTVLLFLPRLSRPQKSAFGSRRLAMSHSNGDRE